MPSLKIHKYTIRKAHALHRNCTIPIPEQSELLDIQWQEGTGIVLWVLCDPRSRLINMEFKVWLTGDEISESENEKQYHLSTIQVPKNGLVFHIFVGVNNKPSNGKL